MVNRTPFEYVVFDDDEKDLTLINGLLFEETGQVSHHLGTNWLHIESCIKDPHPQTLYFLDVDCGGEATGLYLSKLVDKYGNVDDFVVHITRYPGLVYNDIEATMRCLATINKASPTLAGDIAAVLKHMEKLVAQRTIAARLDDTVYFLPTRDITYVSTIPGSNWLTVHNTSGEQYIVNGPLCQFSQLTDNRDFIQVSKSHVANLGTLTGYHPLSKTLFFQGGQSCRYSTVYLKTRALKNLGVQNVKR